MTPPNAINSHEMDQSSLAEGHIPRFGLAAHANCTSNSSPAHLWYHRLSLYKFIMFVPLTIVLQSIYLRVRRLTPTIIGHLLMDLASAMFLIMVGKKSAFAS